MVKPKLENLFKFGKAGLVIRPAWNNYLKCTLYRAVKQDRMATFNAWLHAISKVEGDFKEVNLYDILKLAKSERAWLRVYNNGAKLVEYVNNADPNSHCLILWGVPSNKNNVWWERIVVELDRYDLAMGGLEDEQDPNKYPIGGD